MTRGSCILTILILLFWFIPVASASYVGPLSNYTSYLGRTCPSTILSDAIRQCGFNVNGTVPVVYIPEFRWASTATTPQEAMAAASTGEEYILLQDVNPGRNLSIIAAVNPTKINVSAQPRQYLRYGIRMNLRLVAEMEPCWRAQAEYLDRICFQQVEICIFSLQEAAFYAEAYLEKSRSAISIISITTINFPASPATVRPDPRPNRTENQNPNLNPHQLTPIVTISQVKSTSITDANVIACYEAYFTLGVMACNRLRNFTLLQITDTENQDMLYLSCHGDTRIWSPQHPAFSALGVPYGTPNICHQEINKNAIFFF